MSQQPRAAIYARFSTDMQNARSAEDQARVCRDRAEREGWAAAEIFSDLAISGTTNHRPGLNAMLAAADAGAFEIVIAEALDRVARDQADIATIFKRLEFAGVALVTVSEGRISELHIGMLGTMNALFVKELGNKIRRGQKGAVGRGRVPGGLCYGYAAVPVLTDDGTVERGHRRIVDAEADVIRRIFAEYNAGKSPKAIAHQLNRDGIPSPRGSDWRASTINGSRGRMNGILGNPAYDGRIAYNRVRMAKHPDSRKRISRVNDAADLVFEDAPDLRIVAADVWTAAQARRDALGRVPFHRARRPRHLLSGLVRCGACGGSYTVVAQARWACSRHREVGDCGNGRRISTSMLESRVFDGLQRELLSPDVVSSVVKRYHETRERQREAMRAGLRAAEEQVANLKREIGRLVDALAAGAAFDEIHDAIADRRTRLAIAEAEAGELAALPTIILHPQIVEAYRRKIAAIGATIAGGTEAARFAPMLRSLIDSVCVSDAPGEPGNAAIEVTGSLATVLAIATGTELPAQATTERWPKVVAKERYSLRHRLRTFSA